MVTLKEELAMTEAGLKRLNEVFERIERARLNYGRLKDAGRLPAELESMAKQIAEKASEGRSTARNVGFRASLPVLSEVEVLLDAYEARYRALVG